MRGKNSNAGIRVVRRIRLPPLMKPSRWENRQRSSLGGHALSSPVRKINEWLTVYIVAVTLPHQAVFLTGEGSEGVQTA